MELTGQIVRPGDAGWEEARRGFAEWANYDANVPQAVVFCWDAQDVANAVRWARVMGVPARARSGRHSYEGYSSLVKNGLVIDVSDIDFVRVASDRSMATVGAGIDMIDLSERLGALGVSFPMATGKSVGLAGLTLGGGFGVTSRKWGLTCDSLVAVEIVTADGTIRQASETENPDLFWACRGGGGGNFGIATSFTFRLHPVENTVVFSIAYSWDMFEQVVERWEEWQHGCDVGITSFLTLLTTQSILLRGQFTAGDPDLAEIDKHLAPMRDTTLRPQGVKIRPMSFLKASRAVMGIDPKLPEWYIDRGGDGQIFKSSSTFAYDPLPRAAIQTLKKELENAPTLSTAPSQPSMIQLLGGGGAIALPAVDATAAFHRKARFVVQYDAYWTAPQDGPKTIEWIARFRRLLSPYTRGAYVNYVDSDLTDPLLQYYGDNLSRLIQIKRMYDPGNFFAFPQSISVDQRVAAGVDKNSR